MKIGAVIGILFLGVIFASTRTTPAEATDLTIPIAGRVSIELLASVADFSNTLSIVSPAVGIVATGCDLETATGLGGAHILSERVSQDGCRVDLDADTATAGIQGFPAGTVFEFEMCAQADADADCEFVWSSNSASNSDGHDHVQTTTLAPGVFQLAWEDRNNLGDNDFNDLMAVVRVQADSDGDGLWDDWETSGIDTDADGVIDLDLTALGADPNRKDIFLEIDYIDCTVAGHDCAPGDSHSHRPKAAAIAAVVDGFADAPVTNPDESTGITLHVDVDDAIPHQNFLSLGCGFGTSFDAVKADSAFFGPANPRLFAYHYAIFGHRQAASTTSSGCGELPGNDFLVTLGEWHTACMGSGANGMLDTAPTEDDVRVDDFTNIIYTGPNLKCDTTATGDDVQFVASGSSPAADLDGDGLDDRAVGTVQIQAGTLMHQLGHNLQLCHGGEHDPPSFIRCNTNRKPNYLSIMNYAFQTLGIPGTDPDGAGPLTARVNYSQNELADLDENNLNEPAGIRAGTDNTRYVCPTGAGSIGPGTGAIDWNCDGDGGTDASVAANINGDSAFGILTGFDDWDNLKFDFQNTGDFKNGVHDSNTDLEELDFPTHLEIAEAEQVVDVVVSIAAAAGGGIKPPQRKDARMGDTIRNGDFLIGRTGANSTLGNGIDEDTTWSFDFTKYPNWERFREGVNDRGLRSAQLTLALIPKNRLISTDTLQVGDLPPIGATKKDGGARPFVFPPFQNLPINSVSIVEIELLSFYTSGEVLNVLRGGPEGQVPMLFEDDAIVVLAHLRLVPSCRPGEVCPASVPKQAVP